MLSPSTGVEQKAPL
ncbi:hypothetical protein EYF80_067956 [Liparis tanakae]|uniref:Uncharacterized protein n=1 Tax=Liparis tanakae TaxID=230148 RepID=A0A4Z2E0L3_9TELE|nr:hypothetical protein EYF80_067956 [Liparis tanakae]